MQKINKNLEPTEKISENSQFSEILVWGGTMLKLRNSIWKARMGRFVEIPPSLNRFSRNGS